MRVFLSWSGESSRQVADAFREWLPMLIETVEPYMSARDIDKGARWSDSIGRELGASNIGIVCVASSNLDSRWLNFEAGALSKSLEASRVIPFLFDVRPSDLTGPLATFQAVRRDQEDVWQLILTINRSRDEVQRRAEDVLRRVFDALYPTLDAMLTKVTTVPAHLSAPQRSVEEVLDELVRAFREQAADLANVRSALTLFLERAPSATAPPTAPEPSPASTPASEAKRFGWPKSSRALRRKVIGLLSLAATPMTEEEIATALGESSDRELRTVLSLLEEFGEVERSTRGIALSRRMEAAANQPGELEITIAGADGAAQEFCRLLRQEHPGLQVSSQTDTALGIHIVFRGPPGTLIPSREAIEQAAVAVDVTAYLLNETAAD